MAFLNFVENIFRVSHYLRTCFRLNFKENLNPTSNLRLHQPELNLRVKRVASRIFYKDDQSYKNLVLHVEGYDVSYYEVCLLTT